jgi:hypothetical protein
VRRFGGISEGKPSGIMIECILGDDDPRSIAGTGDLPLAGEFPLYCDLTGEIPLAGEFPLYCDLTGEILLEAPELAVLLVGEGLPRAVTVLKARVLVELELERRSVGVEGLPVGVEGRFVGVEGRFE